MSQVPPLKPHEGYQPPKTEITESPVAVQLNSSGGRLSYALHQFLNFIWSFTFGISSNTVSFSDWQQKKELIGKLSERLAQFSNDKTYYKALLQPLKTTHLVHLVNLFEKYPEKAPKYLASLKIEEFLSEAKNLKSEKFKDLSNE